MPRHVRRDSVPAGWLGRPRVVKVRPGHGAVAQEAGGATSCCEGSWSWRTMPTGQVSPLGPWLQ